MSVRASAKGYGGTASLHGQFVRIERKGLQGAIIMMGTGGALENTEDIPLSKITEIRLIDAGLLTKGLIHFVYSSESEKTANFLEKGKIPGSLAFERWYQNQFKSLKLAVESAISLGKEALEGAERAEDERRSAIPKFPENLDKYEELNRNQDWEGICRLNEVKFDDFGTKKEIRFLRQHLESPIGDP